MGGLFADKHARPSIECDHSFLPTSFIVSKPQPSSKNPQAAQPVESESLCRLPN